MPRPGPDAGRRAVEGDSIAGTAYGSISRSLQRRRAELAALMEAGGTGATVARSYQAGHPFEPDVTDDEVNAAVAEAKAGGARRSARKARSPRRPRRDG